MHLTSETLQKVQGVEHGFGSRLEPVPEVLKPHFENRATKRQVHGTRIAIAKAQRQQCGEADGLYTSGPNILVCAYTADCMPVLCARQDGDAIAAVHIGWRGALNGMVAELVNIIKSTGDSPENWVAVQGPCAGPCCYEVSQDLIDQFKDRLPLSLDTIAPARNRLDIPAIVAEQLRVAGFGDIARTHQCTICEKWDDAFAFHSYRRDKGDSGQFSGILIRG